MQAARWAVLEREDVALAAFGQERLDGKVAYTPVIGEGHVFIFLEPTSPRTRDLEENPDFCLHCAMNDSSGSSGEFQTTGIAVKVQDKETRDLAESISNFRPSVRSLLFELYITDALSTAYRSGQPKRRRWQLSSTMAESS